MTDCSFEVIHYSQICKYVQLIGQESFKVGQRRQSPVIQGSEVFSHRLKKAQEQHE